MADVELLRGVPLFAGLGEAELRELADWFDVQRVSPDVRLVGEDAAGYSFFVLIEGAAVATADDATLAELGSGDFFGEVAILGNGRRTATVTTTAPSTLLVMFGTEFRRLQQSLPMVAARIEAEMRRRVAL